MLDGRDCYPNHWDPPVAGAPFYMRMVVRRKVHPGKVIVMTGNVAKPCHTHEKE